MSLSRWTEAIDRRPGRLPVIRAEPLRIRYEFGVVGGELLRGRFTPTPRTRLVLSCHDNGTVTARILETRVRA